MSRSQLSTVLLASIILLVVSAAITLIPYSSKQLNDLGYYSLCPFAPYSSGSLLLAAGLAWMIRSYVLTSKP